MKFRTILSPSPPSNAPIAYRHQGFSMGSCFAEHIGQRLQQLRYPLLRNPFGLSYNPLSLARLLQRLLEQQNPLAEELFEHQGLWHHFDYHGSFSHPNKNTALQQMTNAFERGQKALLKADYLLLTFGTAWVYEKEDKVVNNCHKLPQELFQHRRLSLKELRQVWLPLLKKLLSQDSSPRILLSLSPVRHLRDGLQANQVSKALLRLFIEELQELKGISYFPAYELLLDDLRDYRFYATDLCHPNETAIQYIWEAFEQQQLAQEEAQWRKKFQQLWEAEQHRPLHPQRQAHQAFLNWKNQLRAELQQQWPLLFS